MIDVSRFAVADLPHPLRRLQPSPEAGAVSFPLRSVPVLRRFGTSVAIATLLVMTDRIDPFAELDLKQAIDLRWALRDVRGKRWKLSPIDPGHLKKLIEMGLVEMQNDQPVLTDTGLDVVV